MAREDYAHIVTALEGLKSAYTGGGAERVLEKVAALVGKQPQSVFVDLSAAQEGLEKGKVAYMDAAIREKRPLQMTYVDGVGRESDRVVEPLALTYRWYAWYLFAYCHAREDYRLFKLARIAAYRVCEGGFIREHDDVEMLMGAKGWDGGEAYDILLKCGGHMRQAVREYLKGEIIGEMEDGFFLYSMRAPEKERMWYGLLLSFGADVEVLEPEDLRRRVERHALALTRVYGKGK